MVCTSTDRLQNWKRTGQTSRDGYKGIREIRDQIEIAYVGPEPSIGHFEISLSGSNIAALSLWHRRRDTVQRYLTLNAHSMRVKASGQRDTSKDCPPCLPLRSACRRF